MPGRTGHSCPPFRSSTRLPTLTAGNHRGIAPTAATAGNHRGIAPTAATAGNHRGIAPTAATAGNHRGLPLLPRPRANTGDCSYDRGQPQGIAPTAATAGNHRGIAPTAATAGKHRGIAPTIKGRESTNQPEPRSIQNRRACPRLDRGDTPLWLSHRLYTSLNKILSY